MKLPEQALKTLALKPIFTMKGMKKGRRKPFEGFLFRKNGQS